MADIRLTCAETPLKWPTSVATTDLETCSSCAIRVHAPQPGSLQILTRRAGNGVGDGVNIDESTSIGADYRGQRYTFDEAILHVPGLHVFPGQKAVYPAEYHVHMKTLAAPLRALTLVLPVSHLTDVSQGQDYFAAAAAKPDPSVTRPTLETLLTPGTPMIQYQGPDIRGRTADVSGCSDVTTASSVERQFLLVLNVLHIRATDLERIPREGSLNTDPRNLPALGVSPSKTVAKDRLLRVATLATPGIAGAPPTPAAPGAAGPTTEVECKPLQVVNGRDVVDISGKSVDLLAVLGVKTAGGANATGPTDGGGDTELKQLEAWLSALAMTFGVLVGLLFADALCARFWGLFFRGNTAIWDEKIKYPIFVILALIAGGNASTILPSK